VVFVEALSTNGAATPPGRSAIRKYTVRQSQADRFIFNAKGAAGRRRLAAAKCARAEDRRPNHNLSHRVQFACELRKCQSSSEHRVGCDLWDEEAQEGQHEEEWNCGICAMMFLLRYEIDNKRFEVLAKGISDFRKSMNGKRDLESRLFRRDVGWGMRKQFN
jgi:hypothetical protein